MITDVVSALHDHRLHQDSILFEGAQGVFLDVDHGTFPFVTSSNTCIGSVSNGAGFGPLYLNGVLGITKAYTTRVGEGPFPTELKNATGELLADRGGEFGSVTGRPRRCGWLDIVLLRRAIELNSITSLCLTKLDVLDELDSLNIATAYQDSAGNHYTRPPQLTESYASLTPVYETLPGWKSSTKDMTQLSDLPPNALNYVRRIEALLGLPVVIISTGPERDATILIDPPFK